MSRRLLATLCTLLLALSAAPAAAADERDPSDPEDQIHDIVFPVIGEVTYTDTYDAPRGEDRVHHATDLMGTKMQELVAAADGEITYITIPEASYGYMLRITADDGWVYSYVHMNNDTPGTDDGEADLSDVFGPGIEEGARVEAGQLVGYLGDSGNAEASGPHLHFEMKDPSGRQVNPYWSLEEASHVDESVGGSTTEEPVDSPIPRLAGPDRVVTAVEASAEGWPDGSEHVVIASGLHYSEALPASVLAGEHDAPLLLVTTDVLPDEVVAELDRLGATSASVVGSVDPAVDGQLEERGLTVHRLGRPDDLRGTSVAVAEAVGTTDGVALLVNHDRFADGISGAALAAGRGWPILLTADDYVFQESVDTWRALDVSKLYLVGGSAVIGDNIADFIESEGITVERLAGPTRYTTSVAVADENEALGDRSSGAMLFATGTDHPDALTAGTLADRLSGQVLLVDGGGADSDAEVGGWVGDRRADVASPWVLGGHRAVGAEADEKIQSWLQL